MTQNALLRRAQYQPPDVQRAVFFEASSDELADPEVISYLVKRRETMAVLINRRSDLPETLLVEAAEHLSRRFEQTDKEGPRVVRPLSRIASTVGLPESVRLRLEEDVSAWLGMSRSASDAFQERAQIALEILIHDRHGLDRLDARRAFARIPLERRAVESALKHASLPDAMQATLRSLLEASDPPRERRGGRGSR